MNQDEIHTNAAAGAAASAAATVAKAVVKTRAAAEAAAPAAAFVLISSWFRMVSDWFLTGLSWFLTGFLTGGEDHYAVSTAKLMFSPSTSTGAAYSKCLNKRTGP